MSKCPETILAVALILTGLSAAPVLAQEGDATAGKKVFNRCRACHDVGEGAKNKIGPHLNDLYGRAAGGLEDYNYSPVVKTAGAEGLVWNDETLAAYLADPRGMLPGNRMAFPGLKKDKEITDLLASGSAQYGTQTFDQSLYWHFKDGLVSAEDAQRFANNPEDLALRISGISTCDWNRPSNP